MSHDTLRLIRNLLLRTFAIGFAIVLLMGIVTIAGWGMWTSIAGDWFHTDAATLTPLVLEFFIDVRFYLLFVILAPALAIHWTLKKERASGLTV